MEQSSFPGAQEALRGSRSGSGPRVSASAHQFLWESPFEPFAGSVVGNDCGRVGKECHNEPYTALEGDPRSLHTSVRVSYVGFPKIRGTFLGVPILRIIVFWGLYWGPLILGKYHVESASWE